MIQLKHHGLAGSHRYALLCLLSSILLALSVALGGFKVVSAADDSQFFPETNHTVSGKFLAYWKANGGLPTFGYPITDPQNEVDPETGKTFLTQWFERNRFELHPELAGTKYEVLLGLLGNDLRREALKVDPDFQRAAKTTDPSLPANEQIYFDPTGHNLSGLFYDYWRNNGGLERFGYPISEVHNETDTETGNIFQTQWFERARFEFHPENEPPYNVLLGLLGNQIKFPKSLYEFVWKIPVGSANLPGPNGLATDAQSNLYVVDSGDNQVVKYTSTGLFITKWGSPGSGDGQFNNPTGITVDSQNNVYVADTGNNRVQKFDNSGKFLGKTGTKGSGDGQFNGPHGLAADSENSIYVADTGNNRVLKFSSTGQYLGRVGEPCGCADSFNGPIGLAVDSHDNLYVADSGNNQVERFNKNSEFVASGGSEGNGEGEFNSPTGLALDASDALFVADTGNNRVQKFDTNTGDYLGQGGSFGTADSQFNGPTGLTFDAQGNIYVADSGNHRIQKFRLH